MTTAIMPELTCKTCHKPLPESESEFCTYACYEKSLMAENELVDTACGEMILFRYHAPEEHYKWELYS